MCKGIIQEGLAFGLQAVGWYLSNFVDVAGKISYGGFACRWLRVHTCVPIVLDWKGCVAVQCYKVR